LIGRNRIYCTNGVWETNYDVRCDKRNDLCYQQPNDTTTSYIAGVSKAVFKTELSFSTSKMETAFLKVFFTCTKQDTMSFLNKTKEIKSMESPTPSGVKITIKYQEDDCIDGQFKYIPKCRTNIG
jgi:hypothetical protein